MYFFAIIDCLTFLLINAMPVCGIVLLTKRLYSCPAERTAAGMLIYFVQELALFLLLGHTGTLSLGTFAAANILTGILWLFAGYRRENDAPAPLPGNDGANRFCRLLNFTIFGMFITCVYSSMLLGGTDTWLYHLYFPSEWIKAGMIYPVSLAGLPHEYFPIAGEALFGSWLIAGNINIFYPALQVFTLLMAIMAMTALWKFLKYPALFISGATVLLIAPSIVNTNAIICNTDVMTGSFLVTGIAFMLLALLRRENKMDMLNIILSGISLGIAAGMKYSGLVAAPLLAVLLLGGFLLMPHLRKNTEKLPAKSLAFILAATISALIFYLPNFLRTGNPFYPVKIAFLFPQGIDFPRETNTIFSAWSFFVSDNFWNLNHATGILYALLPPAVTGFALYRICRKKSDCRSEVTMLLALAITVVFFIHLLIYPAMAQARQIIPLLLTSGLLLPEILTSLIPEPESSTRRTIFCTALIWLLANTLSFKPQQITILLFFNIFFAAGIVYMLLKTRKLRIAFVSVTLAMGIVCSFYYFCSCWQFFAHHMMMMGGEAGKVIGETLLPEVLAKKDLRIASAGSWFNALITLRMETVKIENIPVNAENTTSPHLLKNIASLRGDPVPFPVYLARLREKKITHMIVDLSSHADYLDNRQLELEWAANNPEHFELLYTDGKIFFFAVK